MITAKLHMTLIRTDLVFYNSNASKIIQLPLPVKLNSVFKKRQNLIQKMFANLRKDVKSLYQTNCMISIHIEYELMQNNNC